MTRDELVELMAISAFWEAPTRWGIPGGDFKNISERDRAAFRNMMYVALTELEKHAVVLPTEPTDEIRAALSRFNGNKAWPDEIDAGYRDLIAARPR